MAADERQKTPIKTDVLSAFIGVHRRPISFSGIFEHPLALGEYYFYRFLGAVSRYTAELPLAYNRRSEPIMEFLATSLLELITQTSTNLPPDVRAAMSQ